MKIKLKKILLHLKPYFNLTRDKEDEKAVVEQVSSGVVFRGANLWILMFAILIASLGLNVNSTAVIIGAMLISPLMGPIIGMGLAVGINDYDLLKRALKNYLIATLISVVTATVYFLISPLGEAKSELLARTSPSLYDVLIAFCGGAAGVLALTTKSKGQVIPGVAIATALMPPLCTAGYGLANGSATFFFGAFYLFFINTVFIALSTFLGVKLLRFSSINTTSPERMQYGRRVITIILIITLVPAIFLTANIIGKDVRRRNVEEFINRELSKPGRQILTHNITHDTLQIVAVGINFSNEELTEASSRLEDHGLKGYTLNIIQDSDPGSMKAMAEQIAKISNKADAEMITMKQQLGILQHELDSIHSYDTLSIRVEEEAAQLFNSKAKIRIGNMVGEQYAIVDWKNTDKKDNERMEAWLRTRVRNQKLKVIVISEL